MATVLDYAGGVPSAASIKAAGHIGAVRYISPDRTNGKLPGKPVHRAEVDDFDAHGLKMAVVWQFGKEDDADVKRGYEGGVADAKAAQAHLDSIRMSGHPIFFAVDFPIEVTEWNDYGADYFRGAASVLGKQRVGIYGHSMVCHWAGPEDDVIAQVEPGRWLAWITKGWSTPGETGADYGVLYQRIVDTRANPGPKVGGVTVDINDVLFPEFGWRALDEYQQPEVNVDNLPNFDRVIDLAPYSWMRPGTRYTAGRRGKIKKVTRHHMAGIGDGVQCIQWWRTRSASAHAAVDRWGKKDSIIPKEHTAWANADSDSNNESYTIEHSNETGLVNGNDWDPGSWNISDATLRGGAELAAEVCLSEGLGRPVYGVNIDDHCDHGPTSCPHHLAEGGMYHERWMRYAQEHYDRLVAGTINTQEGLFMSLSKERQEELAAKIDRIHFELTHNYQSRYVAADGNQSAYRDTSIGYALEDNRKIENIHADILPWVVGQLGKIERLIKGAK